MTDRREAADRRLYKRLVISHFDFTDVRQFVHRLRGTNGEVAPAHNDKIQRDALSTAVVVGYARPFSANRQGDVLPQLPDRFIRPYSPIQRELHARLIDLRNEEFAHSDPTAAEVEVFIHDVGDGGPLPIPRSRLMRVELPSDWLYHLSEMLNVLYDGIFDEMRRIEARLKPGDRF